MMGGSPRLLHALAFACIAHALITFIIYERIVAQDETAASSGSTAESYYLNHGGMKSLLNKKFGRTHQDTSTRAAGSSKGEAAVATRVAKQQDTTADTSIGEAVLKGDAKHGANIKDVKGAEPHGSESTEEALDHHETPQAIPIPAYRRRRRRFPKYGTPEFSALCPWTDDDKSISSPATQQQPNCTFLARPTAGSNEGIAAWTSQVVMGHLRVVQTPCSLLIDYGKHGVDVPSIVQPYPNLGPSVQEQRFNWSTPLKFICDRRNKCYENEGGWDNNKPHRPGDLTHERGEGSTLYDLARVPSYRHAYVELLPNNRLHAENYVELRKRLNGFQEEIGFACSLGKLFHLSKSAARYEPKLFTELMPALTDADALVIALYIRTGFTDRQAYNDETNKGEAAKDTMKGAANSATQHNVKCALTLEKEFLSFEAEAVDSDNGRMPKRIVWLVVSDSMAAKNAIKSTYGHVPVQVGPESNHHLIKRNVIFTTSRGAHTKPRLTPSTADLADALIDWFLIAESDVVVTSAGLYSFGLTAGLRTARPIYGAKAQNVTCIKEGGGVECSCKKLYDESDRIERILLDNQQ